MFNIFDPLFQEAELAAIEAEEREKEEADERKRREAEGIFDDEVEARDHVPERDEIRRSQELLQHREDGYYEDSHQGQPRDRVERPQIR